MSADRPAGRLPWSVPVAIGDIPEDGKRFDLEADAATREQVAQLAALRTLPRLQATFHVGRQGPGGLRVEGEVSATVGQNCVVTLEPVENEVREAVNLVFAPPRTPLAAEAGDAGEEAEIVDPGEPEPLTGDRIDLGALATEFLILGIDPYPRKAGATFQPPAAAADESAHPFAALAALKKAADPEK
jgi:uncharacterized metal-binding protein YceD (DUF177 family)